MMTTVKFLSRVEITSLRPCSVLPSQSLPPNHVGHSYVTYKIELTIYFGSSNEKTKDPQGSKKSA